jgi:hypothetical protein
MRGAVRWAAVVLGGVLVAAVVVPATAEGTPDGRRAAAGCASMDRLHVPGAERQEKACLTDLTTAGTSQTGHTDPADWAGLHAAGTQNPTGVPGIQIDGYFPDSSTLNATHGWNHDSQFVIRLPDRWNGGLVVAGSPGVREQYANDFILGDWALARGYAFAATDKGNVGAQFFTDGARPGDALAEWNLRVTQLTVAAKAVATQAYRRAPKRTLAAGVSNGGYLVRWQLENRPWLYDGGVDWEGTLWRPDGHNLLTFLPTTLREYPRAAAGDPAAHDAILAAGFAPGSELLWDYHYKVYWDLTQRIYREELDPSYDGDLVAGVPFCAPGTPNCDADYDYAARPPAVREAVRRISLTGRIGKPLLTLHGTLDTLLPITEDSDTYTAMTGAAGRAPAHRYYRIAGGNHVDGLYDAHPGELRPMLPCFRTAFTAMEGWLDGHAPPPSATVPRPAGGDVVNSCELAA